MAISNNLTPGMIVQISSKLFKVESCIKVAPPKGAPFMKSKLKDLDSGKVVEKNFKLDQTVKEVNLAQCALEYLYLEGKDYLFLDIEKLEQVIIPKKVIENKSNYLKEGVEVTASLFGETIFTVDLPQFLELMVAKVEDEKGAKGAGGDKVAYLETGAKVEVPSFIEPGDIIKVDTRIGEYIQRV